YGASILEVTATVTGTGTFANATTTQFGAGNGGTLNITVNGTTYPITVNDTDTLNGVGGIVANINGTAGLSGLVEASVDTSGGTNKLKLTAKNTANPESTNDIDFTIEGSSTDALTTRLGITEQAYNSRNLLDLGMVGQGETLDIAIGSSTTSLTFGTGAGEISTLQELKDALQPPGPALPGGAPSVDASGHMPIV